MIYRRFQPNIDLRTRLNEIESDAENTMNGRTNVVADRDKQMIDRGRKILAELR